MIEDLTSRDFLDMLYIARHHDKLKLYTIDFLLEIHATRAEQNTLYTTFDYKRISNDNIFYKNIFISENNYSYLIKKSSNFSEDAKLFLSQLVPIQQDFLSDNEIFLYNRDSQKNRMYDTV
jgi:hypothetical protein